MKLRYLCLIFVAFTAESNAVHLNLHVGSNQPICQNLFKLVLSEKETDLYAAIRVAKDKNISIPWSKVKFIRVYHSYLEKYTDRELEYAQFDIDNDGKEELVLRGYTWLAQRPSSYYKVIEGEFNINEEHLLSSEDFVNFPGIISTPPWPYRHLGILHLSMFPFSVNGTTYITMVDHFFGQKEFLESSFLIGKYTGQATRFGRNDFYNTDNVQVVCQFSFQPK